MRKSMTAASTSPRVSVQKTTRKKNENVLTSVGDEMPSSEQAYTMVRNSTGNASVGSYSEHHIVFHITKFANLCLY
jgi:hypothetical protein